MGADGGEEKEATGGVPWAPLHWAPRPDVQQMTNRENKCPHHSLGLRLPLPACLPRHSGVTGLQTGANKIAFSCTSRRFLAVKNTPSLFWSIFL